jgi:hypothetical protein
MQEGPKAKENFERTMTALFRIPKSVIVEKIREAQKRQDFGRFTQASALPFRGVLSLCLCP